MTVVVIDDRRRFLPEFEQSVKNVRYLRHPYTALSLVRQWIISGFHIDQIFLDFDLGEEGDISPIIKLMEESAFNGNPLNVDLVLIHTANPVGRKYMVNGLSKYYEVLEITANHYFVDMDEVP